MWGSQTEKPGLPAAFDMITGAGAARLRMFGQRRITNQFHALPPVKSGAQVDVAFFRLQTRDFGDAGRDNLCLQHDF